MATDQVNESYPPFDYGISVRWRKNANTVLEGSICGFRRVNDPRTAEITGFPQGTVLALIEIHTGESVEIPLNELELI